MKVRTLAAGVVVFTAAAAGLAVAQSRSTASPGDAFVQAGADSPTSLKSSPAGESNSVIMGSRAKSFESLRSLSEASDLIVRARVLPVRTTDSMNGVPSTTTTIVVEEVLKGADSIAASQVQVRQLGSESVPVHDGLPLLKSDHEYILYLDRFESGGRVNGSSYVPTGATGVFEATPEGEGTFRSTDPVVTPGLPASVTVNSSRAAAQ